MSYGFLVQSQSGYTQIDENLSNYQLYATGTATNYSSIPYYGSDQLVLIRIPYGGYWGPEYDVPAVEFRIYRLAQNVGPRGTHGLRVYSGNGTLRFDSNNPLMKVFSITAINNYTLSQNWWGIRLYGGSSSSRPWILDGFQGPVEFINTDGGMGNTSAGMGPVASQRGDNAIYIEYGTVIPYGPPVVDLWLDDGPRYYLLGE